jgi:hypothetical protein
MKFDTVIFEALHIDPCVFFKGTDAEIEAAEEKEARQAKKIESVIFSNGFMAMEYTNAYGQKRILHPNTRGGALWQISYIDPDGVPAMHESYIKSGEPINEHTGSIESKEKLINHFMASHDE